MKEIIIPDIHDRTSVVDRILAHEKDFDRIILDGDYFDGPGSEVDETIRTLEWMRGKMTGHDANKFVWIHGNHDMPYIYDTRLLGFFYNSGYNHDKNKAIKEWVKKNEAVNNGFFAPLFQNIQPYFYSPENNIFFSHAGVSDLLLEEFKKTECYSILENSCKQTEESLKENGIISPTTETERLELAVCEMLWQAWSFFDKFIEDNPTQDLANLQWHNCLHNIPLLYGIGSERGGYQKVGGITWGDTSRFVPIPGVNQVFGHTVQRPSPGLIDYKAFNTTDGDGKEVIEYSTGHSNLSHGDRINTMPDGKNSVNIALDCHLRYYAVVENGILEIREVDKIQKV